MHQATSIQHQHHSGMKTKLVHFTVYTVAVCLLSVLLYKHLFTSIIVVPLIAGLIFIALRQSAALWEALLWQTGGLFIGNLLLHYFYVLPIIYKGQEPWSEEILMRLFAFAAQAVVAFVMLSIANLVRNKSKRNFS